MRIISVIAMFALTTVAYAEVTPTNSGEPEAISLPTRILRGEIRFRPRRPLDNNGISANGGTSAKDQAPSRRKQKIAGSAEEARSTENVGGLASARDQATTGTRPKLRRRNGLVDLNHESAGKNPAYTPAAFSNSASSSIKSQKSALSLDSISLGSSNSWITTLKKVLINTRDQPFTGSLPAPRRQNGQVDVNHDNAGKNAAYSPAALRNSGSSSVASQMSSLSSGSIGSWSMTSKKSSMESEQGFGKPSIYMGIASTRQEAGSIGSWSMTSKMSSNE
jgi:hypothetical protein